MIRRIENLAIEQFIQEFSNIFKDIQQYSTMLRHIEEH